MQVKISFESKVCIDRWYWLCKSDIFDETISDDASVTLLNVLCDPNSELPPAIKALMSHFSWCGIQLECEAECCSQLTKREILYVKPVSVELAAPGAVVRQTIVYEKTELFMCQKRSRLLGLYFQGLKYEFFRILKQPLVNRSDNLNDGFAASNLSYFWNFREIVKHKEFCNDDNGLPIFEAPGRNRDGFWLVKGSDWLAFS